MYLRNLTCKVYVTWYGFRVCVRVRQWRFVAWASYSTVSILATWYGPSSTQGLFGYLMGTRHYQLQVDKSSLFESCFLVKGTGVRMIQWRGIMFQYVAFQYGFYCFLSLKLKLYLRQAQTRYGGNLRKNFPFRPTPVLCAPTFWLRSHRDRAKGSLVLTILVLTEARQNFTSRHLRTSKKQPSVSNDLRRGEVDSHRRSDNVH